MPAVKYPCHRQSILATSKFNLPEAKYPYNTVVISDVYPFGHQLLPPSPLVVFPSSYCSDPTRSPSHRPDQILVQKWFSLETNRLCFLAISMFFFASEGITFGSDQFWSKVFKYPCFVKFIVPYKSQGQINNKLIY